MGHASGCLESSALPPNQYNEDSLPPAAILVFFYFHGATSGLQAEMLKNKCSAMAEQRKISKTPFQPHQISCCNDVTAILPSESVAATM